MLFRILIIVILLTSFYSPGFSNENDTTIQRIFTLIYNQQFTDAEKALEEKNTQIEPFFYKILKLDLFWWKYSITRSKVDAKTLNKVLEKFENTSQNASKDKVNELIRTSYQMRYEVKRYNLIGALFIRSDVRKQIEVLKTQDLSFLGERKKLFEFYLVLINYFDENISPFSFGSKSDEYSKSILTLEDYSNDEDLILSTMAHYFLGRIYMKVEKQPEKGQAHFKILADRFPKNSLFYQLSKGLNPKF